MTLVCWLTICGLQRWKKDLDPVNKSPHFALLYVRLPRLPLVLWSEPALEKILKPTGTIYKTEINSEVLSKGPLCMEVDISKPLKMEIKYRRDGLIRSCILDYENITNICYSGGSHDHKFDNCILNSKNISSKVEKVQVIL